MGLSKAAPVVLPTLLSLLGKACARMDLTAVHEILLKTGYKDEEGAENEFEVSKKKVKKTNVPLVEVVYGGLATLDLQKAKEKELEMALQDRVMEETKDKKNVVEAYVYDMRNKNQRDELTVKLQEVEDWLYEDGEDETKGVYVAKLEELKKSPGYNKVTLSNCVTRSGRREDHLVINLLIVSEVLEAMLSKESKFDHIDISEMQKGDDLPTLSIKTRLLKNFRNKDVAIGRVNAYAPSNDEAYNIIVDEIFDGNEILFDRDGKFEDIIATKMINWERYSVQFVRFLKKNCTTIEIVS